MSYDYCQIEQWKNRINVNGIKNPHHDLREFARCHFHQHCSMTDPTFSTKETAHANSTGGQPGGDINANKKLQAAKCVESGAKIYPSSLLKPHLARHQLKHESLVTELRELLVTIERMKIA